MNIYREVCDSHMNHLGQPLLRHRPAPPCLPTACETLAGPLPTCRGQQSLLQMLDSVSIQNSSKTAIIQSRARTAMCSNAFR